MGGITSAILAFLLTQPMAGAEGATVTPASETTAQAVIGGGCFWCLEAVYEDVPGVLDVTSGYAGGAVQDPSYQQVITGRTGHAEVVRITYDPEQIDFDKLLEIFWVIHDPTTADRQGNDVGNQYRSIILFQGEEQERAARASIAREEAAGTYRGAFTTQVAPLQRFWPAEDYHQDYFRNNPDKPYCAFVVAPKVMKYRKHFGDGG
jgi:peptide-methionine (S)-S-oxide reductase